MHNDDIGYPHYNVQQWLSQCLVIAGIPIVVNSTAYMTGAVTIFNFFLEFLDLHDWTFYTAVSYPNQSINHFISQLAACSMHTHPARCQQCAFAAGADA